MSMPLCPNNIRSELRGREGDYTFFDAVRFFALRVKSLFVQISSLEKKQCLFYDRFQKAGQSLKCYQKYLQAAGFFNPKYKHEAREMLAEKIGRVAVAKLELQRLEAKFQSKTAEIPDSYAKEVEASGRSHEDFT